MLFYFYFLNSSLPALYLNVECWGHIDPTLCLGCDTLTVQFWSPPLLPLTPSAPEAPPKAGCQQAGSAQALLLQWAEALSVFQQAADWIGLESRKSLWGQFWSAHQRFFKYLCIAAKVQRLVELARQELSRDKVRAGEGGPGWAGAARQGLGDVVRWDSRPGARLRLSIPTVCGHRAAVHRGGADPRGAGRE